jgi:alkyldihydroxyacetonephosphate synthase
VSGTSEFEAGIFGPDLEEALRACGFALGHHPDSFMYSTLGGWLATRSAGTHSNIYGKIEDMVLALRLATPTGVLTTRPRPAASTGPDLNRLITGSEGTLGVITQATMRVHPLPEWVEYRMVLMPSFESGCEALQKCVRKEVMPSMARLSDELETELIFASKHPSHGAAKWLGKIIKHWLRFRGMTRPCALFVGFEGPRRATRFVRDESMSILRRAGGFDLGTGPGQKWTLSRYDVPYLRDCMMDYGVICDSFETAALWSDVIPLYRSAKETIGRVGREVTGYPAYVGCHISHLYRTGACLYFTVGVQAREGSRPLELLEQYGTIKAAATTCFVESRGAVSHHHAIGLEHQAWIAQEMSPGGVDSVRALKRHLDPSNVMNPGTLVGGEAAGPGHR